MNTVDHGHGFTSTTEMVQVTKVFAKVTGCNRFEVGRVESDCGGGFTGFTHVGGHKCRFGSHDAAVQFVLDRGGHKWAAENGR